MDIATSTRLAWELDGRLARMQFSERARALVQEARRTATDCASLHELARVLEVARVARRLLTLHGLAEGPLRACHLVAASMFVGARFWNGTLETANVRSALDALRAERSRTLWTTLSKVPTLVEPRRLVTAWCH
jgi:hypothetical protein